MRRGNFEGGKGHPIVKYRDTLRSSVRKQLNRSRCPPREGAVLGERVVHCKVWGLSAVSCAETAELIDLPFELWTRVGRMKHKFKTGQF